MKPATRKTVQKLLISLVSMIVAFGVLELGIRVYWGEYRFQNFWEVNRHLFRSAYPAEFHKQLGWVPREGYVGDQNVWGTQVTILEDGIRANSKEPITISREQGDLMLAIGDSYTFGDMASNHETWPAYLEALAGIRTLNGGVFGYAVDQTYLRMKLLAGKYRPTHIVMSLIPRDIQRCELSERTAVPKPYFEIVDNALRLRNDHITETAASGSGILLGRTLGHSLLMHKLMLRAFPEYWLQSSQRTTQVHSYGADVTCLLFKELESFLKATPSIKKFYLLIQYKAQANPVAFEVIDRVLGCVNDDVIEVVDLRDALSDLWDSNPDQYRRMYVQGHMTEEGNYFVARILSETMAN